MDTELNSEAYSCAVAEVLMGNSVAQNVHIRQMVFVEGNGEMFTKGPVGHAVVVTPKGGWFQGKDDGVHACVSSWQRIRDNSIPPRVKCAANYQNGRLALLRARLDGYDCALLLNDRGKVSEEPGGQFFSSGETKSSRPGSQTTFWRALPARRSKHSCRICVSERSLNARSIALNSILLKRSLCAAPASRCCPYFPSIVTRSVGVSPERSRRWFEMPI